MKAPWIKEPNMSHSFCCSKELHMLRCWNTPQVCCGDWRDVRDFLQCKVHFWRVLHQDVRKETSEEYNNRRSYEWSTASAVCVWFLWNQFFAMTEWWHFYSLTRNPPQKREDKLSSTSRPRRPERQTGKWFCSLIGRSDLKKSLLIHRRQKATPTI